MRLSTSITAVVLFTLLAAPRTGSRAAAAAGDPTFAPIMAERVAGDPAHGDREVLQFLRADAKGRLFLLHGDTLETDQIQPSGKLVPQGSPPAAKASGERDTITDAALSPDGDSWLLFDYPERLALLNGKDLRELPASGWDVSALAYTVDGPLIAVLPAQVGGQDATAASGRPLQEADFNKVPFLLHFDDQKWQTLVPGKPFRRQDKRPLLAQDIMAERGSRLAAEPKGAVWVAQQDAYVLKRFSRMGVLQSSIVVGGGQVQWKERSEDDWKRLEARARVGSMKLDRSHLARVQVVHVVRAFTVHDHQIYLVVETPAGLALDRWDTDRQALERVQLPNVTTAQGRLSVAAGRDGLYLAGPRLGEPVWRLDWQRLEEAKWKPVPEAVVESPAAAAKGR